MKSYGLLLVAALLVAACAKKPQEQVLNQTRALPSYHKIHVVGDMDVRIYTGRPKSRIQLEGDSRDLEHIRTDVEQGMLNVTADGGYPKYGKVKVIINTKYLNLLAFDGYGHVRAKNIKSRVFDVDVANDGSVYLSGKIGLRKLRLSGKGTTSISGVNSRDLNVEMIGSPKAIIKGVANIKSINYGGGSGFLNMYWVKSRELTVKGRGYATLQLAGIVNELHVDLVEKARFNGRYLRAKRGFIKTHNLSVAEVQILNKQHCLAKDKSNIYYFNGPEMQTDLMANNGAVLDMQQRYRFASSHFEQFIE